MQYDRKITISVGNSRKSLQWMPTSLSVSEFYDKLKTPVRSSEPLAEYLKMPKSQQDTLKDCSGGFVGGTLKGNRRKANCVTGRELITLDFDNVPGWGTDDIIKKLEELGCGYCVYSTRKHAPNKPRLRVIVPTDRVMTPDEYEPCARRMAAHIGINMADPTTFDCSRLFYYPSCCSDSEYYYNAKDAQFISADFLLSTYADWHNIDSWPQVPGTQGAYQKLAAKQGDPEAKIGMVGAWCRTYNIYAAMDFIPGLYEPVDNQADRYTYLGGSTTGGAVIYGEGRFLYSHHATDVCSGKLVNAFDLVRLHKFADLDDDADPATPNNKLPSYIAMCKQQRVNVMEFH